MRPITVSIPPNQASFPAYSNLVRLDEWADAPLGVQVAVNGAVNFTVQHSFDEGPDSLVNPITLANMMWDTGLVPAGAVGGTAGITFAIPVAPIWMRIMLNSGAGSARMTLTQYNNVEL
jgi:hypothetical protein